MPDTRLDHRCLSMAEKTRRELAPPQAVVTLAIVAVGLAAVAFLWTT